MRQSLLRSNIQAWVIRPTPIGRVMIGFMPAIGRRNLHKIYLASSAGLESDVIYQFPIQFIARNTEPISIRYSINVEAICPHQGSRQLLVKSQKDNRRIGFHL
jgi:hypothetical protein